MQELKSPKLLNSFVTNNLKKTPVSNSTTDIAILQQIIDQVQQVEIIKNVENQEEEPIIKNQKVLKINENVAEQQLIEYIQFSIIDYQENQYSQCIYHLKQAEQILTAISYLNPLINYFLILRVNLGVVFYSVGWLEQSFTCFEDAILALKKTERNDQEGFILTNIRVHCYLQCCIILSEIGQHNEALAFSKMAQSKATKLLIDLQKYVQIIPQKFLIEEILKKSIPILKQKHQQIISNYQSQETQFYESLDLIFASSPKQYLAQANILSYIQMNPINLTNFMHVLDYPSIQQYIHMITLFIVTLYCVSTESKFVTKQETNQFTEAENYLSRALEIAYLYLPKDMPIINQLINVHNKYYDVSKQAIDEEAKETVKKGNFEIVLLKPIIEQNKGSFVIPIIRKSKFNGMKNRTKSMKEQQFQNIKQLNVPPDIISQTYDNTQKNFKRKLRSVSTTNKQQYNSPNWMSNQYADVYIKNNSFPFKAVQIKKTNLKFINKTVDLSTQFNVSKQTNKYNRSQHQMKKQELNIIITNANTPNIQNVSNKASNTQKNSINKQQLKRKYNNQQFNFEQLTTKSPVNLFVSPQKVIREKNFNNVNISQSTQQQGQSSK